MPGEWKNELSFEDGLRLERSYFRDWALGLDFVSRVKTVKVVGRGEGDVRASKAIWCERLTK